MSVRTAVGRGSFNGPAVDEGYLVVPRCRRRGEFREYYVETPVKTPNLEPWPRRQTGSTFVPVLISTNVSREVVGGGWRTRARGDGRPNESDGAARSVCRRFSCPSIVLRFSGRYSRTVSTTVRVIELISKVRFVRSFWIDKYFPHVIPLFFVFMIKNRRPVFSRRACTRCVRRKV